MTKKNNTTKKKRAGTREQRNGITREQNNEGTMNNSTANKNDKKNNDDDNETTSDLFKPLVSLLGFACPAILHLAEICPQLAFPVTICIAGDGDGNAGPTVRFWKLWSPLCG